MTFPIVLGIAHKHDSEKKYIYLEEKFIDFIVMSLICGSAKDNEIKLIKQPTMIKVKIT